MSETAKTPELITEDSIEEVNLSSPVAEALEADETMKALEAIPDLLVKLEEDNTRYDLHFALINALKLVDIPDQLESARRNMHAVFPLTEDLWLDWINDTKSEAKTNPEKREKIMSLYKLAQEDYYCINVYRSFVEFILEEYHSHSITNTEEITTLIESTRLDLLSAVAGTRYDVKQSQLIWKPYSEFELEVLQKLNTPEQLQRVKTMYLDRLAVLHIDCQDTFNGYSSFVTAYDNSNYETNMVQSNKVFSKTKRAADERDFYELKLVSSNESLEAYYEYIESEQSSKNMSSLNNVRNLYERAIVKYCVDPTLWDDYILYLTEKGRVNAFLDTVTTRALRNCPWSGILYAHRARLLESELADNDTVIHLFHTALSNKQLLSSGEDVVAVLMAKIDYERRKIDWEDPEEDLIMDLQVAFEESLEYLKEVFGEKGDPYYRIEKYYAFISAKRLRDEEHARELWEIIVDKHGRDTEAWIGYITFERDVGNYQKCELLFKKAHQKHVDNPSRLLSFWVTLEHEVGSLQTLEYASIRINRTMKILSKKWQQEAAMQVEMDPVQTEIDEAREKEKKENEKRKKGLHRMESKKKAKEKKAASRQKEVTMKEPQVKKDKEPDQVPENKIEEESVIAEAVQSEQVEDKPVEEPTSRKRKASDNGLSKEEAKKHKASEPIAPRPIKPFAPKPRATRGLKPTRGKSLKLTGTRALSKNDVANDTPTAAETSSSLEGNNASEGGNSNDDFRKMLLGKK